MRRPRLAAAIVLALAASSLVTAQPAAALPIPGLVLVSASVVGNTDPQVVTVPCPHGQVVYGLGGEIKGGNGLVHMVTMLPNAGLTSVTVVSRPRASGPLARWQTTAYAICGNNVIGPHLEASLAASWTDAEPCDGGTKLYGVGARHNGHPVWTFREVSPMAPFFNPVTAQANLVPAAGAPGIAAAAICAPQIPGLQSVVSPLALASTVVCPAAKQVHGAGGLVGPPNNNIVIEGIVPNAALTGVTVTARNAVTKVIEPTRAFAVCA